MEHRRGTSGESPGIAVIDHKRLPAVIVRGSGSSTSTAAASPLAGWQVEIADAQKVEGPRAAGLQDRQDRPPGCWPSGALSQPVGELSPIAHSNARFALTAVGPTPTPESISVVRAYLAYLAQAIRPHVTGTTYVNFLDLDGALGARASGLLLRRLGPAGPAEVPLRPAQRVPLQPQCPAGRSRTRVPR